MNTHNKTLGLLEAHPYDAVNHLKEDATFTPEDMVRFVENHFLLSPHNHDITDAKEAIDILFGTIEKKRGVKMSETGIKEYISEDILTAIGPEGATKIKHHFKEKIRRKQEESEQYYDEWMKHIGTSLVDKEAA